METPTTLSLHLDFAAIIWPYYLGAMLLACAALVWRWRARWRERKLLIVLLSAIAPIALIPVASELSDRLSYRIGSEYFNRVCERYAGDVVNRTVQDVEGFVVLTPRNQAKEGALKNRFGHPDPYGRSFDDHRGWESTATRRGVPRYKYVEVYRYRYPTDDVLELVRVDASFTGKYIEVLGEKNVKFLDPEFQFTATHLEKPSSRYGYTWHAVAPAVMRLFWIAGSETQFLDT